MFNRFKGLIALFSLVCVFAIVGGSAYFYFGGAAEKEQTIENKNEDGSKDNNVFADNILENYEFGVDKDLNETYTYYFFPSTLYMTNDFFDSDTMPETVFGYNEVILDDNGDPVLDSNGQPQYKIIKNKKTGISKNNKIFGSYYEYLKEYLNKESTSYLAYQNSASKDYPIMTREINHDGLVNHYYYYGHEYFEDPYVINNPYLIPFLENENKFNDSNFYIENAYGSKSIYSAHLYFYLHTATGLSVDLNYWTGNIQNFDEAYNQAKSSYKGDFKKAVEVLSPIVKDNTNRYGINLNFTEENRNVINTFLNSEKEFILNDNYDGRMVGKSQYRNDRFGFWTPFYDWEDTNNSDSYIENSASRYLPIKITVNGNLTPDDMAKVIPSLSASMFDNNMWFDFTANGWTYVSLNEDKTYNFNTKEYNNAVGGFTAKDITNIFDIMQNPSKYADGDNIIRLFPVFSNGKNGDASAVSDGGGDAIQASFSYAPKSSPTIQNDMWPSSTKLTYSSYTYSGTANGFYNYSVNYAVLKNVEIKKDKYNSITFKIDTTYFDGEPHWGGHWIEVYPLDANYITNFVTTYGEGLYTFYLFLGNRGVDSSISNTKPFPNVNDKTLLENVVSYSDSSNELFNKHLISVGSPTWAQTEKGRGDQGDGSSVNTPNYSRPVALAVEKVTNLRLVSDIPIAVDDDGNASANQDWDSIDGNIHQGLLNAKNFTIADEVYGFDSDIYKEDNIDLSKGTRLDTNNPYIYVIQNADFRFVNNLYFQIRFSNDYINNAMNVTTDYSSILTDKPNKYVAYSVNGQILKFKFQDSDDKDVFIQNATAGSGTDARQGFKLKDYNARGIYDIILISHGTSGSSQQYYMYVNRHTNSFIKLFYGNPDTFEFIPTGSTEQQTGNRFVRHKLPSEDTTVDDAQTRVKESTLLWNGQTYLGEYLTTSSTGTRYSRDGDNEEQVIKDPSDASLYAAIRDRCGLTPGTDNIYKIIDAVTGRVVAYYNSGVGRIFTSEGSTGSGASEDAINLFTIMKNYVLYIDPDPIQ